MNSATAAKIESLSTFKVSLFIIFILVITNSFYFNHTVHFHNQ